MSNDIFSSAMELNTAPEENKVEEKPEEVKTETEEKPEPEKPVETIESLEDLSEKAEETVPLKKYMVEKNSKRALEKQVQDLQTEITRLQTSGMTASEVKIDVKELAKKYDMDEDALADILQASYNMSKERITKEIEDKLTPQLAEFEGMKKEKEKQAFELKFQTALDQTLNDMPEFKDLVDKEDLKTWIRSGKYSKLSLPQLIEQKYGKFVQGKKTIENNYNPTRESAPIDISKPLSDEEILRMDKDPELKKRWAQGLQDRLRNVL